MNEFNHEILHEAFEEIEAFSVVGKTVTYNVRQGSHVVDQLTFLGPQEMRVFVDNYPCLKRYYTSNLPITTMEQFQQDFERTGLKLTRIGKAKSGAA